MTADSPAAVWNGLPCSGCCATSRREGSTASSSTRWTGLARSLLDFSKLVELFDRHKVSFVSVTQHFNTTDSMGRLTLNILLSFAQFEREIITERIRDKIAAAKKKGKRCGGMPLLGYDLVNGKLEVNPAEAKLVRHIFDSFLRIGSPTILARQLNEQGHAHEDMDDAQGEGAQRRRRGTRHTFTGSSTTALTSVR